MPRSTNRLALTSFAAAGLYCGALVLTPVAFAEPSPGVPCLDLVSDLAAAPEIIPQSLEGGTAALNEALVPVAPVESAAPLIEAAAVPAPPVEDVAPAAAVPATPVATEVIPPEPAAMSVLERAIAGPPVAPMPAPAPAAVPDRKSVV